MLIRKALILINAKIFQISFRRHEEFNAVMALELPDVPPMEDVFRNLEIPSNSHLITEEPYTSVIGRLVKKSYLKKKGQVQRRLFMIIKFYFVFMLYMIYIVLFKFITLHCSNVDAR